MTPSFCLANRETRAIQAPLQNTAAFRAVQPSAQNTAGMRAVQPSVQNTALTKTGRLPRIQYRSQLNAAEDEEMGNCQIIQVAEAETEIYDNLQEVVKKSSQPGIIMENMKKETDKYNIMCEQCNFICMKEITLHKHNNTKHPRSNTVPVTDIQVGQFSYIFGLRH